MLRVTNKKEEENLKTSEEKKEDEKREDIKELEMTGKEFEKLKEDHAEEIKKKEIEEKEKRIEEKGLSKYNKRYDVSFNFTPKEKSQDTKVVIQQGKFILMLLAFNSEGEKYITHRIVTEKKTIDAYYYQENENAVYVVCSYYELFKYTFNETLITCEKVCDLPLKKLNKEGCLVNSLLVDEKGNIYADFVKLHCEYRPKIKPGQYLLKLEKQNENDYEPSFIEYKCTDYAKNYELGKELRSKPKLNQNLFTQILSYSFKEEKELVPILLGNLVHFSWPCSTIYQDKKTSSIYKVQILEREKKWLIIMCKNISNPQEQEKIFSYDLDSAFSSGRRLPNGVYNKVVVCDNSIYFSYFCHYSHLFKLDLLQSKLSHLVIFSLRDKEMFDKRDIFQIDSTLENFFIKGDKIKSIFRGLVNDSIQIVTTDGQLTSKEEGAFKISSNLVTSGQLNFHGYGAFNNLGQSVEATFLDGSGILFHNGSTVSFISFAASYIESSSTKREISEIHEHNNSFYIKTSEEWTYNRMVNIGDMREGPDCDKSIIYVISVKELNRKVKKEDIKRLEMTWKEFNQLKKDHAEETKKKEQLEEKQNCIEKKELGL